MSVLNVQDFPTDPTLAVNPFTGDSGTGGTKGAVPAPASGDAAAGKFLKADGTWGVPAGGGGGGGTVTSVGLTMPAEFTVSGSPVTSSGTLAVTKANASANTVYSGPSSGAAAAPAFRAMVSADLPSSPVFAGNPQAPVMWIPIAMAADLVAPSDNRAHIPGVLVIPSGRLVNLAASTGHTLLEVF